MKTRLNKPKEKNTALIYEGGQPGGQQFTVREVYRGEMRAGDEEKIKSGLIDGQVFVPQVAGMTPAREGLQRMGHKFIRLELTEDRNTDPRKIRDIVESLSTMKQDLPKFQEATKAKPVWKIR